MTSVSRLGRPIMLAMAAVMMAAAVPAHGQTLQWARQFGTAGYDAASAVTTDAAGNIYVGGVTRGVLPGQASAGNGDAFVSRYAPSGDLIWFRQFGTAGEDGILAEATDVAGYVYVAGFMGGETSIRGTAGLLAKYDSAGNQLWLRQFGPADFSTAAVDVDTDPAGNVYVAGSAANVFGRESFLAKYSASGQQLWSHSIITSTLDPMALATDKFGHVYVVGRGGFNGADAVIAQYDELGNQVWQRQFGTASNELPQDVATDALGDVYIVGLQDGYDLEASFLAQYDTAGNQNWVRTFSAESFPPWAMTVAADAEGNAFVAGFVFGPFAGETSAGHFDAFVLQYDRAGTQRWVRQFGTPEQDEFTDIAVDDAGNIYVAGTTPAAFAGETHLGSIDAVLARLTATRPGINERIAETRSTLAGMAIAGGIRRSLEQKLASAQRSVDAGHTDAICGPLTAFANEVSAQDGKQLTAFQAALLRTSIGVPLAEAGCHGHARTGDVRIR
jgi:hypothetical protein